MKHFNMKYPIIQAPMAGGITTPELVSTVSNLGGLGSYAGGYIKPNQLEKDIKAIQKLTQAPFCVNLFVPNPYTVDPDAVQKAIKALDSIYTLFELTPRLPSSNFKKDEELFNQQIDLLIALKVPICSFTFGIPQQEVLSKLKKATIAIIGTATSLQEALAWKAAGADAIVAQSAQAGGHRASFMSPKELLDLPVLLNQLSKQISIPIIAAGGIMDKKGISKAIDEGAAAVQMGTAFLLTNESGASEVYKDRILEEAEDKTVLTTTFSGKLARGIRNKFIDYMESQPKEAILPYPLQNSITKSIRKTSIKTLNGDYMSLWCGQNGYTGKKQSTESLFKSLIE